MLEHRHEMRLPEPIAAVFNGLLKILARGRWGVSLQEGAELVVPRRGCRYSATRKGRFCTGEVLECLRPVSLIVEESLHRPPSRVTIRQKWRVEPVDGGTLLRYEVKATLNRAANLRRRNWEQKLVRDYDQLIAGLKDGFAAEERDQGAASGVTGQKTGNNSIVRRKITTVSGRPSLR